MLVMYLQNTKPIYPEVICSSYLLSHLGKNWVMMIELSILDIRTRNIFPLLRKNYIPRYRSREAAKGKWNWCEIVTSSKSMPPYQLKLVDDSGSDSSDDDEKTETASNHDDDLEIESKVDSVIEKKEEINLEMSTKVNVDKEENIVEEDKMEKEAPAENMELEGSGLVYSEVEKRSADNKNSKNDVETKIDSESKKESDMSHDIQTEQGDEKLNRTHTVIEGIDDSKDKSNDKATELDNYSEKDMEMEVKEPFEGKL